ncbi:MAG: CvpA family protein [Candidatus Eremiobacterota bacterium]
MTGIDVLLAVMIVLQAYIGHRRGIIGEVFDVLALAAGAAVGLNLFIPVGRMVQGWTEWADGVVFWFGFLLTFTPAAVVLLLLGMHLDRVTRDGHKIPDDILNWLGAIFAFFKAFLVCWLVLMLLKASPLYTTSAPQEFRYAPVINFVESTGGKAGIMMFDAMAPDKARKLVGPFLRGGF